MPNEEAETVLLVLLLVAVGLLYLRWAAYLPVELG